MRERQREVQLYRGQVPSPGRPTVAWREDRVRFWEAIAGGAKTEAGGHVGGHRVADQPPGPDVEHRGEVQPPLSGGDIGDVARPDAVGAPGPKPAAHQVGRRLLGGAITPPAGPAPLVDAANAVVSHEPADALVVDAPAPPAQLRGHPRRPVRPAGVGVDLAHLGHQLGLSPLNRQRPRLLAVPPVVERLAAHFGNPASGAVRESLGLAGSNPPIAGHCPDSLTQKAVARMAAHAPLSASRSPGATAPAQSAPRS